LACVALGLTTTIAIAWAGALEDLPASAPVDRPIDTPGRSGVFLAVFGTWAWRGSTGERLGWGLADARYDCVTRVQQLESMVQADSLTEAPRAMERACACGAFPAWWGTAPRLDEGAAIGGTNLVIQDARGWPCPALWCQWTGHRGLFLHTPGKLRLADGVELLPRAAPDEFSSVRALPCRPVYTGLLVNTSLFSLAWCLVLFAPGNIRARCRRHRGRCVGCGYDLSGVSGKCPECGQTSITAGTPL
jgi:hypothetical protein